MMDDADRRITHAALLMFAGRSADNAAQSRFHGDLEAAGMYQHQAYRAVQMAEKLRDEEESHV